MKNVVSPYISGDITLRMLEERDLPLTLSWRNNAGVRKWFKNSAEIDSESHRAWFESYKRKSDDYVFISEVNGSVVGQLAVYKIESNKAEVGRFISSPSMSGKGLMKLSLQVFLEFIATTFDLNEIFLEVYEDNERAIALYQKLGFKAVTVIDGLIHMRLVCNN